jgi:tRNA(adenine34) deaminase
MVADYSREAETVLALPAAMRLALDLAREAADLGEVPVGAVITRNGTIIASASNRMRQAQDPTAHAEMLVIRAACLALGAERLNGCELWVTLEPCAMCAGAISHARISRLYYAASDPKSGAIEQGPRLFTQASCHHKPDVYNGLGEAQAAALLTKFFAARRTNFP